MKVHTIQEFLKKYDSSCGQKFIGKDWDSSFVSQLLNDFGLPPGMVEFIGCIQNEYNTFDEYMILYKFSRSKETAEYLGECLKLLGKMITRLRCVDYDFGIRELETTKPDYYYILLYGLSGKKEKE